jgi:hypothetical protein
MTRFSPAQARQDHRLGWRRLLHRFARLAGAAGSTSRRREPNLTGQMIAFGPCCGDDVRPASAWSGPPARRRGRRLARDTEMEAGR